MPIHVLQHPLAKVYLSVLRDKTTDPGTFRYVPPPTHFRVVVDDRTTLRRLAGLVGLEATSSIQLKDVPDVSVPRCPHRGRCSTSYESLEQAGPTPDRVGKTLGRADISFNPRGLRIPVQNLARR